MRGSESLALVAVYTQWAVALVAGIITLRIIYTIIQSYSGLDMDLKSAVAKAAKAGKAVIIAVCIEGIIESIKRYLFL